MERGVKVNSTNNDVGGNTALHRASERGNLPCL
jgi:hypothetical protein